MNWLRLLCLLGGHPYRPRTGFGNLDVCARCGKTRWKAYR